MTGTVTRRGVLASAAIGAATTGVPAQAAGTVQTVLFEQTYLQAKPGMREDLIRFIKANWFAMDEAGLQRGIFTSYALFEDIDDNTDWDIVMAVGYPQRQGYEDPATKAAFDAIRKAHVEVKINGRGLKELGAIVRHHRLAIAGSAA